MILATIPMKKIKIAVMSRTPRMDDAIGRSFSKKRAGCKRPDTPAASGRSILPRRPLEHVVGQLALDDAAVFIERTPLSDRVPGRDVGQLGHNFQ